MKIIKTKDYEHMSRVTANLLSAQVIMKPDCVLGLATGSTPVVPTNSLSSGFRREILIFLRLLQSIWMNIKVFPLKMIRATATL